MAKKRKSSYRGYVNAPFGFVKALQGSVNAADVLVGAIIGLVGGGVVKMLLNKLPFTATLPAFVKKAVPGLSSVGAGAALYYLQKQSPRGKSHFVGATAAGATVLTWDMLKGTELGKKLGFDDYVSIPGLSAYYPGYSAYDGVIVDNPAGQLQAYNGVIVDNPAGQLQGMSMSNMEALALSAMEPETYDGMGYAGVP